MKTNSQTHRLTVHRIKGVKLSSYWAQDESIANNEPYPVCSYLFEGETGSVQVTTVEPNGIVIEDSGKYIVDIVKDEKTGKKCMFIRLKAKI